MAVESVELMEKYGKPLKYDREFRGPNWRRRSCTDVPCLLIFVAFLAGWAYIGHFAITQGNLSNLGSPTNSMNQKCGIDSQVLNKKYLFYFNFGECVNPATPITGCNTPQVCVEKCPAEDFDWNQKRGMGVEFIKQRLICVSDVFRSEIRTMTDIERAIEKELCVGTYYKSEPLLNHCIWSVGDTNCALLKRKTRYLTAESLPNATQLTMSQARPYVAPPLKVAFEEPISPCHIEKELSENVKAKIEQTSTRLSKLIGNIATYFTKDQHSAQQIGDEIVEDIMKSVWIVLAILLITMVVSLIFIAFMRWVASPLLWLSVVGVLIGLAVATYLSVRQYMFFKENATVPYHGFDVNSYAKNLLQNPKFWLYLSIFLGVCWVVIFLLVIALRTRIRIATAIIKEGSKAVTCVQSTMFFPLFSWLLIAATVTFAVAIALYLNSLGEKKFRMIRRLDSNSPTGVSLETCTCTGQARNFTVGEQCDPTLFAENCFVNVAQRIPCSTTSCSFAYLEYKTLVQWFRVYNVFGLLWLFGFVSAFSEMVLAATFANWYWTFKKRDVPFFTLTRAFRQTAFYHLGTVAFGSLILAICRMICIALEYIDSKLKRYNNEFTRAIMCCLRCFFWLLENFLRFINRNAYIMCAIHGKNFCTSATDAFNLIMRNCLRVVTVDKVTDFLFFLSKVLLTATAGVSTYYYVQKSPVQLHYYAVPTAMVVVPAYLITSVFFSVYSMAVDSLFLCFLEDCERNDGSAEKPYYMSKQLMRILGKRNKLQNRARAVEEGH